MGLPVPVGRQREVLYLPEKGHHVILGTAGSGKTTLAILRASYLQGLEAGTQNRTLLVTFNNTLVTYLRSVGWDELLNVDVRTYHRFARGYLNSRGRMGNDCIAGNAEKSTLIGKAIREMKQKNTGSGVLNRPPEVFLEEIQWIQKSGIKTLEEYVRVKRVGRQGTRISRKDRPTFFEVYQRYLNLRSKTRYTYDWEDIAHSVLSEFQKDSTPRMYKHIVIDEGQDFSPMMLISLTLAIPTDGSLTFFGDMAQQVYGTRLSWRSAGLIVKEVWPFQENYRNTRQIARLALAMSNMPHFKGVPDLVEPTSPTADGPPPTVVPCQTVAQQTDFAVDQAGKMGASQKVAILLRDRRRERLYLSKLKNLGLQVERLHRDLTHWTADPGVSVGTYHSAKGLEFDAVILPYCSDRSLPAKSRIRALGAIDEAMSEEGQLLYVAITRARADLIILYSGGLTSLLPSDSSLYNVVRP